MNDTPVPDAPPPPRLVALWQDAYDDHGNLTGFTVIAWSLVFPDMSAVTVPAFGKPSASVWLHINDALKALDAAGCEVRPRPYRQWWRDQPTAATRGTK